VSLLAERAVGVPTGDAATGARRRPHLALLPWLIAALAWTLGLLRFGTPGGDIALYAAYLAVAIVLPGTLVHRALRGSRGNLPEDLGLGSATGLLVLIAGWALCAAIRLPAALPAWPLLVVALFVAVPGLRRHWRIPAGEHRPLPAAWSWVLAAVVLALIAVTWTFWRDDPLPPATADYYQDLLYHLALVHEMTRSMPFQVPQLAGDTLRYHYLADADMAAASMITGISPAVLLLRLWVVPIGLAAVLVCAAIARELTGKWWAGALGGAASLLAWPLVLGSVAGAAGGSPFSLLSPSQTYALPLLALLVAVSLDVLRGRRLGWTWALVLPLALACAGAKESTLPPFVAGLGLAVLVLLAWHRDRLRAGLALLGTTLLAMAIGVKVFAGGGASVLTLQPFAILDWVDPYRKTIGADDPSDGSRLLPLGIAEKGAAGVAFALGLFAWWAVLQTARLAGLRTLTRRGTRTDPAAWLLAGIGVAGTGGLWLLWHPSASQTYFYLCAAPFATLLTVWLLADQARGWRPVAAGLGAGALWALLAPDGPRPRHDDAADWMWAVAEPLLLTAGVAAATGLVVLLAWRAASGRFAWRAIPAGLTAAILGASLGGAVDGRVRADLRTAAPRPVAATAISADEMRAALWLGRHSRRDDLIATNVHCKYAVRARNCDSRAFWVVGLSGRRALVESWGYTDQAVAANGVDGLRFMLQPAPHPERFALNERVFARGDAADVDRLRHEFHVRWLFGDERAGPVSPDLARVGRLRYRAGPVSIFQL
jgi:MYXO-CTERM domain-containing protein